MAEESAEVGMLAASSPIFLGCEEYVRRFSSFLPPLSWN
jgi:hypothetical protein